MNMKSLTITMLVSAGLLCQPIQELRASTTINASIAVSATVLAFCTVSASALPFGNYSTTAVTANTTVLATCTNGTPYNVGLDAGTGAGSSVTTRVMTGPSSATLNYSLYSNAGYSTVWGNTIGTNTVTGTGNGAAQSLTVYGKIAAGQFPSPGAYNDTVTVTLTF